MVGADRRSPGGMLNIDYEGSTRRTVIPEKSGIHPLVLTSSIAV
jgi:hypothetical protein